MIKPTRVVAGYDLHFPRYNKPTFGAMMALIDDVKPDMFVFGGDQFDNAEISHHNRKKFLYKPRGEYRRNTERFDEEILKPIERGVPNGTDLVWIEGNHDHWEYEFIEEHPEFEGQFERPEMLRLEKRGWEVVPLGHAKRVGHLNIIHGEILTGIGNQAGMYPSRKAVELYGDNVLAGHTHAPQSFAKISPVEVKHKHMGWIAPILGDCNPVYLENRPTAWLNGFVVIEFYNGGMFNLYPILTFNGRCSYGGKVYEG
jgi:predicted phosphodiesterase